ncbi:alpha/beta hydrolase [Brevibacillus humidisoli]|uniref:intracellular short-chain-length polyhydroxyalkanoate depolymerase n=1 Tax=Brevibacillus humidisoli TaxID=2895522 RepID=UPI001E578CBE|nr:alpha/beta hydrolase [Brevibacillus humidisoli]UFJ42551.1 alpha/beta hydrolase [Brevibacillus humidisoli]
MSSVILETIDLPNGETLGYRKRPGKEEVLLLLHGNMTSSAHWDLFLEAFAPDYTIYAVDLRGFGLSSYRRPIEGLSDFAGDVKALVDALSLPACSLVGWSMGGGVAMQYAADHPESVQRLVLLASLSTRGYPYYRPDPKEAGGVGMARLKSRQEIARLPKMQLVQDAYARRDKAFLRQLWDEMVYTCQKPTEKRYAAYLEDMLTQRNLLDVYDAMNRFNISREDHAVAKGSGAVGRITMPTLVIWGRQDRVISEQMTQELLTDIGNHAKWVVLDDCGHSPLVDALPEVLQSIAAFLSSDDAGKRL